MRLNNDLHGWLRRSFSLVALTGALLMGGCTDDESLDAGQSGNGEKLTFTAVAPTGTLSRALWNAEPSNGKLGFNWEDADTKMDLWQGSGTSVTVADMSVNADDRSKVTVTAESINKENDIYAFFPSGKVQIGTGDLTLPVLILQPELTQKGATTDHLRDYMYLIGALKKDDLQSDEVPPMQLGHLCTVLRFNVQNGTDESVRVSKVEMLATEEGKGVNMMYALLAYAGPSDITVNVQDAEDATKGHLLSAGGALSVYAHCFSTEVNDGQFRFRVTVTDADGKNARVFLTKEAFSVDGITTTKSNDASQKIFKEGHYYTFNLDISKTGDNERFETKPTWSTSTVASESLQGEGTEANPYLITSAEDLEYLLTQANEVDYETFTNSHFKLTTDIYIYSTSKECWKPIKQKGNSGEDKKFNGTFDGDNHTIYGTMVCSGQQHYGFFGKIGENGTVKNLHIEADVTGNSPSSSIGATGSVAGYNEGSIMNCTNAGMVTGGNAYDMNGYAGGIVGKNAGGTIANCINYGTVKIGNADGTYISVGGIVGEVSKGNITECTNNGAVIGNKGYINDKVYTGGIVGYTNGTDIFITDCTNTGTVTGYSGEVSSCHYVGGLVGYNKSATIKGCENRGIVLGSDLESDSIKDSYTGGLVGYNDSTVTNCTNSGTVTNGKAGNGSVTSYNGGLVGYNNGTVTNCTNSGTMSRTLSAYGTYYVGGLVGSNQNSICTCCKDESGYSESGTLKPIGTGNAQTQVEGCTGAHE